MYAGGHDPAFDLNLYASPRRNRCRMIEPGVSIFGGMWADIGAGYGLEVRDPTLDTRLMEFCLAVPDAQYRGHGYDRWLIRRAMQGLLPDTVRLNVRRGRQAADLGHRVLASLPECRSVVERLRRSDLARGVLDVPRLSRVLEALQHDVNAETSGQCSTILMPGVMAGMFLLQFS
jgi:asparagine synthase (glutamine-hydrolysing)